MSHLLNEPGNDAGFFHFFWPDSIKLCASVSASWRRETDDLRELAIGRVLAAFASL
ncbi:MAG TPA: hypothetical protein VK157_13425 [Phycisphaerales bacterium]|nr:hypothetical protein [Phycisphaerales bacterium]